MKKQTLFTADTNPKTNAPVNVFPDAIEAYIPGFYSAAVILARSVKRGEGSRAELVYPIAFNYRHYLELRIKQLIRAIQTYYKESLTPLNSEHRIHALWEALVPLGTRIDTDFGGDVLNECNQLVRDLDRVDPTSQTFRYALDKKERAPIPPDIHVIGIETLSEKLDTLYWLLEGLSFTINRKMQNKRLGNA